MEAKQEISREDFIRLYPKLVGRLRGLGVPATDVEDLVQEVFLRANVSLHTFQGRSELDTWVISIAKKVWLNERRRQQATKRLAAEIPIDASPDTRQQVIDSVDLEGRLMARDLLSRVRGALHCLPVSMRDALVLYCKGFKYREISEQLGVSENRVASLIHQARTKIRNGISI